MYASTWPRARAASSTHRAKARKGVVVAALIGGVVATQMVFAPPASAIPPFPIVDTYDPTVDKTGTPNSNWQIAANTATANIAGRYTSDGWTRLTTNVTATNQAANILNGTAFPSSTGFEVAFDYRQAGGHPYNGSGATGRTGDGMTMYLIDGSQKISSGGPGDGLGYAANIDAGTCGVTGGYLGLGLDVYGNYAASNKGNYGGNDPLTNPGGKSLNELGNFVALRGSGSGSCNWTNVPNSQYPWVAGAHIADGPNGTSGIWTGSANDFNDPAGEATSNYRRVWVRVLPVGKTLQTTVSMSPMTVKTNAVSGRTDVFSADLAGVSGQVALPSKLMIGFSASTGGSTDFHDIRNVSVTGLGDASILKTVSAGRTGYTTPTFAAGDPITFTLNAANLGPTAIGNAPDGVAVIYDDMSTLPISNVAWTCTAFNGATCENGASGTGSVITQDWTAPATTDPSDPYGGTGAYVEVTVTGTVNSGISALTPLANTAIIPTGVTLDTTTTSIDPTNPNIQRDQGLTDVDLSNNQSSVDFDVMPVPPAPHFTQTKTADQDQYWIGDPITYKIEVTNDGTADGTASVSDPVSSGVQVTGVTCAADTETTGTGATCTSGFTGNTVTGTVDEPANTGVVFTVTGVVTAAGELTNTATVAVTTSGCDSSCGGGDTPPVTVTTYTPAWTLAKTTPDVASDTVHPGDVIEYQVTATSVSSPDDVGVEGPVAGVVLSDDLSGLWNDATFVAGSAQLTVGTGAPVAVADPNPATKTLTTQPFTLPAKAVATLTYQVQVNDGAWSATLKNVVIGTGVVPPQGCQADGSCQTTHHTNAQIFVQKVAPDGTTPLDGASFTLSSDDAGAPGAVLATPSLTAVTDETGRFEVDGIAPGIYWLTETTAPSGYILLAAPVGFQVNANGSVTLSHPSLDTMASITDGNTITLVNQRMLSALPDAGGQAASSSVVPIGLVLLVGVAGGLVVWLRVRRA